MTLIKKEPIYTYRIGCTGMRLLSDNWEMTLTNKQPIYTYRIWYTENKWQPLSKTEVKRWKTYNNSISYKKDTLKCKAFKNKKWNFNMEFPSKKKIKLFFFVFVCSYDWWSCYHHNSLTTIGRPVKNWRESNSKSNIKGHSILLIFQKLINSVANFNVVASTQYVLCTCFLY